MMNNQDIVATYEMMAEITTDMLHSATAGDWDRVVLLEQQCARCLQRLQANEAQVLASEQRARKLFAIRRMLADDRKIRDLTMPWMAQLSALIQNSGTQRRLASAYGSV
jgi:flagellar protein FliT